NKLRTEKNASLGAARGELARLSKQRENIIQAIKDGVPASEVKDDLTGIALRREELETLLVRSLVDRIELRPNQLGKLDIDLYGDLAGILTLAGKKDRPFDQNDLSVQ